MTTKREVHEICSSNRDGLPSLHCKIEVHNDAWSYHQLLYRRRPWRRRGLYARSGAVDTFRLGTERPAAGEDHVPPGLRSVWETCTLLRRHGQGVLEGCGVRRQDRGGRGIGDDDLVLCSRRGRFCLRRYSQPHYCPVARREGQGCRDHPRQVALRDRHPDREPHQLSPGSQGQADRSSGRRCRPQLVFRLCQAQRSRSGIGAMGGHDGTGPGGEPGARPGRCGVAVPDRDADLCSPR